MAVRPVSFDRAPLRYGFIGPGNHAQENLLPALAQMEGAHLEAVAARRLDSAARAAQRWQARLYTDDWTELVDPSLVDAIVVAASPQLHAQVVARCLASGVSVFVEKPPAPDTDGLRELLTDESTTPAGTVAFVGFNFPYSEAYRKLRDSLAIHGELRSFELKLVSAKPISPTWNCASVVESLLQGLGTHAVDLALRELGTPDRVTAHQAVIDDRRYAIRITLAYLDGRLATLHIGNHSNRLEFRCELVTSEGVAGVLDQLNTLILSQPATASGAAVLDDKETPRYEWPIRRGGYARTGYSPALASFHRSVTEKVPSTSSLSSCLDTYQVLDEVLRQVSLAGPVG